MMNLTLYSLKIFSVDNECLKVFKPLFFLRYFFCDILNFVNVIGQMYFVNTFLGGVFMTYGTEVLNFASMEDEDRSDPMMEVIQGN